MKKIIKIILKSAGIFLFALLLLVGSIELYKATQGNFHSVTEGELYRSAQLDRDNFEYYIKKAKIKTIINLRGPDKGASWYEDELGVAKEHNVTHLDFAMTSYDAVNIKRAQTIIAMMKNAPKPILIHCHGGADRSALISALWLFDVKGISAHEAKAQFKLIYGYFPYLMWTKKKALMDSFEAYVKFLKEQK